MIHSFLLMGQSNMAGRGAIQDAEKINFSQIKVLRNGLWTWGYRPINPDRAFSGVCLAETFATSYRDKYGVEVGLIACADGGTSLDQWSEGQPLYENAVNCARLAARSSTIAGILWHQGESDCAPELSPTYRERFEKMLAAFRRDTGLENVPCLVGGLGDFLANCKLGENLKYYGKVNEALCAIAENDPLVGFVSAEGLGANPDDLHFSAEALHKFGRRYFAKFEEMVDPSLLAADDSVSQSAERSAIEQL